MTAKKRTETGKKEIDRIKDIFEDWYEIDELIKESSTGLVFKAHRKKDVDFVVAIKFYLLSSTLEFITKSIFEILKHKFMYAKDSVFNSEFRFLKKTHHPNIQSLISHGILDEADKHFRPYKNYYIPESNQVRFIITKYIYGQSFDDWLKLTLGYDGTVRPTGVKRTSNERVRLRDLIIGNITRVVEALRYIHEVRKYQHSDIHERNILVENETNTPIVIDFGFAHCFDLQLLDDQPAYTHIRYFSEYLPKELRESISSYFRERGTTEISRNELKEMMFPHLDLYQFGRVLENTLGSSGICDVLSRFDTEYLGLLMKRLLTWQTLRKYDTRHFCEQLHKLSLGYWATSGTENLQVARESNRVIDLSSRPKRLSNITEKLLRTNALRRLQLLNQLVLVRLIYPRATQSRLEHCLSVHSNTNKLISSLLRSPRFCILFDTLNTKQLSVLALLHDINHFPFLHFFQEYKLSALSDIDIIGIICDGKATNDRPSVLEILSELGITKETLRTVLFDEYEQIEDPVIQVMKSIIDSGVDIDKMTYVVDDALHTGVPFGMGVDIGMLMHYTDVAIIKIRKDREPCYHLCFKSAALSALESLLLSRYWSFKQIYWHHTNRAIVAMIKYVIEKVYIEKKASVEEFIHDTLSKPEAEAAAYFDRKYKSLFNEHSLIEHLMDRRDSLYKRIYSVRRSHGEGSETRELDKKIFDGILRLKLDQRKQFLDRLRTNIRSIYKDRLDDREISESDLLLDIPGRVLQKEVGDYFIGDIGKDGRINRITSPFLRNLTEGFTEITQTVRLFLYPTLRDLIGKERIASDRGILQDAIYDALKSVPGGDNTQIR